jgi:hypothetical protein
MSTSPRPQLTAPTCSRTSFSMESSWELPVIAGSDQRAHVRSLGTRTTPHRCAGRGHPGRLQRRLREFMGRHASHRDIDLILWRVLRRVSAATENCPVTAM